MSFSPGSTFSVYTNPSYSSSSDVEGANNITDYSDVEGGYSSTTSASFDFVSPTGFQRMNVPQYAQANRYGHSSQSPPPNFTTPPVSASIPTTTTSAMTTTAATAPGSTVTSNSQQPYQRIARFVGPPPVALACTECRSRHLKCDAGQPSCSRCVTDKRDCNYVKSRRGWKGTRRKKVQASGVLSAQSGTDTEGPDAKPPLPPTKSTVKTPPVPTANFSPPPPGPHTNPLETLRAYHKNSTTFPSQNEVPNDPPPTANLMQLYYAYFHSSHPFVMPANYLVNTSAQLLTALLPVMRYIASVFAKTAPTETFYREAENALFGSAHPPAKNAFTVQALLLFAIGLHAENEQDRAAQVKDIAAELALDLGMNHKEFSDGTEGEGASGRVLGESWRRTWWELYFVDGIIAGIHQRDTFKLWSVECTVPLPCEEADYASGRIPEPQSLQAFDDRYFAQESTIFSSFAYRVEAMRILGQVLAVGASMGAGGSADETRVDAADASLANWGLHLPESKKELLGKDHRVDEMLFQAHMVVNAAIIYLNRPKSHLAISIIPDDTTCTPPTSWSTPTKPMALHTSRTISAANTIAKLLTLPTPLTKHTPFFACIVTLAAIVHLSACSWLLSGDEGFLAKERIRLGVGALRKLEITWGIARAVIGQVKFVAREVFRLQQEGPGGEGGLLAEDPEEVLRFLEEERPLEIPMPEEGWGAFAEAGVEWNGT